ncbi:MAG: hypothetical protein ABSF32_05695 [Ignavibacteria bacterium]
MERSTALPGQVTPSTNSRKASSRLFPAGPVRTEQVTVNLKPKMRVIMR